MEISTPEIDTKTLAEATVCPKCGQIRKAYVMTGKSTSYIIAWCESCDTDDGWRLNTDGRWYRVSSDYVFAHHHSLAGRAEKLT